MSHLSILLMTPVGLLNKDDHRLQDIGDNLKYLYEYRVSTYEYPAHSFEIGSSVNEQTTYHMAGVT